MIVFDSQVPCVKSFVKSSNSMIAVIKIEPEKQKEKTKRKEKKKLRSLTMRGRNGEGHLKECMCNIYDTLMTSLTNR